VDESPARGAVIEEGLREAGHINVVRIHGRSGLTARLLSFDPEVILVDLGNPTSQALEQMLEVSRALKRPTAIFVDQSDTASIQAAMDAGVSAYIVDGLKKERIKPILDMCISRFKVFSRLQDELREAKTALEERKVVDRAKGILMQAKNMSEQDAYALLRRSAMNEKRRIADIAQSIVTAAEVLK
jgi:response regulator NasT